MQNQALDLLRRWLRGETRSNEQSRLERATREDPFLADAWEGFNQNPQADHSRKIATIQAKIAARTQEKQRKAAPILIWAPRLAAAAAVLLLLTFGWKWLFLPTPSSEDLAIQVPKAERKAQAEQDSAVPEVADLQQDKLREITPPASARKALPSPRSLPPTTEEKANEEEMKEAENLALVESAETKPKADALTTEALNNASRASGNAANKDVAKENPPAATRDLTSLQPTPTVGGIVVDERGQRAGGVPVQRDANTFAITNRDGAFELPSAAPAEVKVVTTNDFEAKSLRLDDNDEKVVLQRRAKTQKKSFNASDRSEGIGFPSPEGGFEKFEQYIQDNLEMPFEAKKHMMGGTVTLEFSFEKDGTPTRFNILRGLGFGCDQAAEHIIENGPKWKNVKPGTWVIYKVVFK